EPIARVFRVPSGQQLCHKNRDDAAENDQRTEEREGEYGEYISNATWAGGQVPDRRREVWRSGKGIGREPAAIRRKAVRRRQRRCTRRNRRRRGKHWCLPGVPRRGLLDDRIFGSHQHAKSVVGIATSGRVAIARSGPTLRRALQE